MAVHLTRIYTRTGDDGTTGLADFSRVSKTDPRLVAYADCDETNAALGLVLALGRAGRPSRRGGRAGAERTVRPRRRPGHAGRSPIRRTRRCGSRRTTSTGWRPTATRSTRTWPPLRSFILPGGTPAAALLHQARTVARRAERSAWALRAADPERTEPLAATYLNRLSDLLFILARVANPDGDVLWVPGGERTS